MNKKIKGCYVKLNKDDVKNHNEKTRSSNACDQCDKQYTQTHNLKKHIRTVHEEVRFKCSECGKQASQRTDLKKHIEAAHLNLQLPCDLCGVPFKTRHHRQTHVRTTHGYSSKYYNAL